MSPRRGKTLVWAFKGFIEHHESPLTPSNERLTPGTLKTYKTGLSFLSSSRLGSTLLTEVDMEWYRRFVSRAEGGGAHKSALSKNYIGKLVKLVKRVIRFAENQGAEVNPAYRQREFKVLTEETTSVYLSETEIDRIRELDLENDKGLALTRDLFTIGCYSGLRYSDFTALSQSNVREYEGVRMFDVRSQKNWRARFNSDPPHCGVHSCPTQWGYTTVPERPNHEPQTSKSWVHLPVWMTTLRSSGLRGASERRELFPSMNFWSPTQPEGRFAQMPISADSTPLTSWPSQVTKPRPTSCATSRSRGSKGRSASASTRFFQ